MDRVGLRYEQHQTADCILINSADDDDNISFFFVSHAYSTFGNNCSSRGSASFFAPFRPMH